MAESDSLLAYLVPKLTSQVENAATDSLAYILNNSEASLEALASVLGEGGITVAPIERVETQVTYGDSSRPDAVGYDQGGEDRVIIESKFWASLLEGQASGYFEKLSKAGPSALLFVVPDARIDSLWPRITQQVEMDDDGKKLEPLSTPGRIRSAKEASAERHLMIVSWRLLLDRMLQKTREAGQTPLVEADIRELQGLTERMDLEEMQPLREYEYSPDFARRMRDLRQIYDDVVDRCDTVEWVDKQGFGTSGQPLTGYGRFLKISEHASWFGVYLPLWADGASEDTPLWVQLYECSEQVLDEVVRNLQVQLFADPQLANSRPKRDYVPIRLKSSAEREVVVDDVMRQLNAVADIIAASG